MRFAHPAELFRLPLVLKISSALMGASIVLGFVVEPKSGRAVFAAAMALVLACVWFCAYVAGHERGIQRERERLVEQMRIDALQEAQRADRIREENERICRQTGPVRVRSVGLIPIKRGRS